MSITVTDNGAARRFEARDGDTVAGFADYLRDDRQVIYPHTQVDHAYEGRGVGSALARAALDDARERGLTAIAACPFIAAWLDRHPEYADTARRPDSDVTD
ncbi:GNAT family N-acetyltransferase [Streptomyces sp. RFCAC02]|uniref:GNAT family N-acetyltransferase n=1 Tax=Streptomyces sp. RFCAC02 TaxID=2499143 RepID=UPI00101F3820|nr:GNAT family N-acetyltransferase [Streptomyces sp. RFCAC02]